MAATVHVRSLRTEPLAGRHVVVVEGHDESRDMIQAVLEADGAAVTGVATVDSAVHFIGTVTVDLVLTDISLRRTQDGVWLLQRAQATRYGSRIPFIAMTESREHARALARMGFAAVLIKPIDIMELTALVAGALDLGTP